MTRPITIQMPNATQAEAGSPRITKLALVVDHNPAPVAGEFTFGPATAPLDFEVRVRVDAYSDVRAIATLEDGRQVMAGRFVKASGGCAAPAGTWSSAMTRHCGCPGVPRSTPPASRPPSRPRATLPRPHAQEPSDWH